MANCPKHGAFIGNLADCPVCLGISSGITWSTTFSHNRGPRTTREIERVLRGRPKSGLRYEDDPESAYYELPPNVEPRLRQCDNIQELEWSGKCG